MNLHKIKYIALFMALLMFTSSCSLLKKNTGEDVLAPVADAKISEADTNWAKLMEGNVKFVKGRSILRASTKQREKYGLQGQDPHTVVITCSDARLPPEYIFGTNLGEIFVIRTAGNVVSHFEIGSVEYALAHLDVPLVVVLGHSNCGAVEGAIDGSDVGYLGSIFDEIKPLVEEAKKAGFDAKKEEVLNNDAMMTVPNKTAPTTDGTKATDTPEEGAKPELTPEELLTTEVTRLNVYNTIDKLYQSDLIMNKVAAKKAKIIGALYDTTTGAVTAYNQDSYTLGNNILYKRAIEDAMLPEASEIFPLVPLIKNNANVKWNSTEDKVLVAFWHDEPKKYAKGAKVKTAGSELWVYSQAEMERWFAENQDLPTDRTLRFEQLLGFPQNSGYTHFTMAWVSPKELLRPAYNSDVTTSKASLEFPNGTSEEYKKWFENKIVESYYNPPTHPWTRLGYTYDWADNGKEYGLSEFTVNNKTELIIENTLTTEQYIDALKGNVW